jgi:hypothetical protein
MKASMKASKSDDRVGFAGLEKIHQILETDEKADRSVPVPVLYRQSPLNGIGRIHRGLPFILYREHGSVVTRLF